ncbi:MULTISPECIES: DJ-1/PfpI family protein [Sorangium]|uniref:Glutamine amidotransferase n=1 Tax=Sorangium cellulosum TaxID=56 RepID=A0A4P2QES3_SORCE|nr:MULTISPECIES: DJ-1/PfpI family protein [Sorangium]AUX28340.1 glutamine amidotransferase [Sorangium cellulosum]WCQ87733.1 Isonitrile hydratase [Sorangium sp. Soce836]
MQHIAMLIYPGFTALDLIGPQSAFSILEDTKIHLVWKTLDAVTTDSGITLFPTATFDTCPEELEILFVPGGVAGTIAVMKDGEVLDFLAARAEQASYVTSVCTGSLVLGAAGLLRGHRATTHWAFREVLPLLEAERVDARYVEDRNRITGGGVTSGIDFGLRIAAKMRGEEAAQTAQLVMEYDPDPPFQAGSPESAPPAVVEQLRGRIAQPLAQAKEAAEQAAARW